MYCYKVARLFDTACSYSNFYYPNANAMDGNSIDFLLLTIFLRIFGMGWPDLHIRNSIFDCTVHYICTMPEICHCVRLYANNSTFCSNDTTNRTSKIHMNRTKIVMTCETKKTRTAVTKKKLKCSMQMWREGSAERAIGQMHKFTKYYIFRGFVECVPLGRCVVGVRWGYGATRQGSCLQNLGKEGPGPEWHKKF